MNGGGRTRERRGRKRQGREREGRGSLKGVPVCFGRDIHQGRVVKGLGACVGDEEWGGPPAAPTWMSQSPPVMPWQGLTKEPSQYQYESHRSMLNPRSNPFNLFGQYGFCAAPRARVSASVIVWTFLSIDPLIVREQACSLVCTIARVSQCVGHCINPWAHACSLEPAAQAEEQSVPLANNSEGGGGKVPEDELEEARIYKHMQPSMSRDIHTSNFSQYINFQLEVDPPFKRLSPRFVQSLLSQPFCFP